MNARELKPLFEQWDAATAAWTISRDEGQRHLSGLANSATALGYLGGSSSCAFGAAAVEAAEVRVYDSLREEHRALLMSVDGLRTAVRSLSSIAKTVASLRSRVPSSDSAPALLLSHDVESLAELLSEVVAMYQAQLSVCEGVAVAMHPDTARASSSNTLTL
jgi:hypothetical protein